VAIPTTLQLIPPVPAGAARIGLGGAESVRAVADALRAAAGTLEGAIRAAEVLR
jgi:hypothetical protein